MEQKQRLGKEADMDRIHLSVLKGDIYLEYKKGCALGIFIFQSGK